MSLAFWKLSLAYCFLQNACILQIPMVILSAGGDPKTRSQQLTMLESAVEIPLYKEDLQYI